MLNRIAVSTMTVMAVSSSPAPAQSSRPIPEQADVMVAYERTGGFAGVRERITVHDDGKTVVTSGKTTDFILTTDEYRRLRNALRSVTTTWSSAFGCDIPDHFTYALAHRDWQAVRCHRLPDDWQLAVAQLDELISRSNW
ncbi:hypothetical protein SMC26_22575 [Actinomadura fulvescens]|uniref:Secreted protein n=1 Tax=Actinomadura fulvescens TaxID=46160 RepID=A0ABP6D1P3_9ACTN